MPKSRFSESGLGFAFDFVEYSKIPVRPAPIVGKGSVITINGRLESSRGRGHAVPNDGKHALGFASDVLRLGLPLYYPALKSAAKPDSRVRVKHAPIAPSDLTLEIELLAMNRAMPEGLRLYDAIFCLTSLAPLRFNDIREVGDFWSPDTSACGRPINQMGQHGSLMSWGTPLVGLSGCSDWALPIVSSWNARAGGKKEGTFISSPPLFLRIGLSPISPELSAVSPLAWNVWSCDRPRAEAQASFFSVVYPDVRGMLQFDLEKRHKLGRWSATSVTPDRYDRATCAPALSTR